MQKNCVNAVYSSGKYNRYFRNIFLAMAAVLLIANLDKDSVAEGLYRSATEYDYPPFSVTNEGVADGFSVELLKAAAQEVGIGLSFKIDEWNVIKNELKEGQLDVLPLVGYTEERDEFYDFTVPYIVLRGNIFVRKGNEDIQAEDDLYGKSIIVMEGDNSQEYTESMGFSNNLILVPTYTEAFNLLSSGQYDAVLAQGIVGEKIISDLRIDNIEPVYVYDDQGQTRLKLNLSGYEQKFSFAVKEGDKELLAKLNEGLAIVSVNGTYDELYQKWFPFLVNSAPSTMEILKHLLFILVPIAIILLVMSIIAINHKVKQKTMELTKTFSVLEFERNKYYSTLISIGDGVIVVSNQGIVEMMNPVAVQMIEVELKQAIGRHYSKVVTLLDPQNRDIIVDPISTVLESGKAYSQEGNILMISNTLQSHFIEVKASPVFDDTTKIYGVVMVCRDVSKVRKHIHQIEFLSFHDSLTGLYNRRFFEEEMRRLDTPRNYPITIAMADLNGLKLVNDAFGHLAGDDMLICAAELIKTHCREGDIISRWGGDEFVMIFPRTTANAVGEIIIRIEEAAKKLDYQYGLLSMAFGFDSKTNEEQDLISVFKNAESYMYKKKVSESEGAHGETIRMIVATLFEKSPRDKEHCERVSRLGAELAEKMLLHQSKVLDIKTIGLLHDIGKIIIPQSILDKPEKLTDNEYEEITKHPLIGYRMLSTTNEFAHIAKGVLHHHERVDGRGYPEGLMGEQISIEARIIGVVDAYDAMTAERPYRIECLSERSAALEIMNNAGKQFDAEIARVFVEEVLGIRDF